MSDNIFTKTTKETPTNNILTAKNNPNGLAVPRLVYPVSQPKK